MMATTESPWYYWSLVGKDVRTTYDYVGYNSSVILVKVTFVKVATWNWGGQRETARVIDGR